jgi:hypothetical protein
MFVAKLKLGTISNEEIFLNRVKENFTSYFGLGGGCGGVVVVVVVDNARDKQEVVAYYHYYLILR